MLCALRVLLALAVTLGLAACAVNANNLAAVKEGIKEEVDPSSRARLVVGPTAEAGRVGQRARLSFQGTLVVDAETGDPLEFRVRVSGGANDSIGAYQSSVPVARFQRYSVPTQTVMMMGTVPIVQHHTLYGADLAFASESLAKLRQEGLTFEFRSAANNIHFGFAMPATYVNALFERL